MTKKEQSLGFVIRYYREIEAVLDKAIELVEEPKLCKFIGLVKWN
jgi:hypothetical protein